MKSIIIMPDKFLSRSWTAISLHASILIARTFLSLLFLLLLMALPVFTSIDTSASVGSITKVPPDFSQTLLPNASFIASLILYTESNGTLES